jgi:hypothetical protein
MYAIVRNPKLMTQESVQDMIGSVKKSVTNPMTGVAEEIDAGPRLSLEELPHPEAMAWNFRGFGVTQFTQRQETLAKLKEALVGALGNPTLTALTNLDVLWKRIFQVSQIPDWEEIVKSPEEIQKMVQFLQQQQMVIPQGGGAPQGSNPPPDAGREEGMPMPPRNMQTNQPIGV